MATLKQKQKLSNEIYTAFVNKPRFNCPYELIDALKKAKRETKMFPFYSLKISDKFENFIKFLTKDELMEFKQFDRKPRWCNITNYRGEDIKTFSLKVASVYAGIVFPDRTPYRISGKWRKGGLSHDNPKEVQYDVDIYIDCGGHIDTQTLCYDRPMPIKKVLKEAVEKSLAIKGKCFDGYWY